MLLFEISEPPPYHKRCRMTFLRLQQALLDDWEDVKYIPPKPMDEASGELFPGHATAVKKDTQNAMRFTCYADSIKFHVFDGTSSPMRCAIDMPAEPESIKLHLELALQEGVRHVLDYFKIRFIDAIDETNQRINDDSDRDSRWGHSTTRASLKRALKKIYDDVIKDWYKNYQTLTGGFVNSDSYAEALVSEIDEVWDRISKPYLEESCSA